METSNHWHRHTYNGGQTIHIVKDINQEPDAITYSIKIEDMGYCGTTNTTLSINAIHKKELQNLIELIETIIYE